MVKLVKKTEGLSSMELVTESGVNRLEHWIKAHDCAIITSSRKWIYNTTGNEIEPVIALAVKFPVGYSDEDKRQLFKSKKDTKAFDDFRKNFLAHVPQLPKQVISQFNKDLKFAMMGKGYGVTYVKGVYTPDSGDTEFEDSLFVVNLNDNPKFIQDMIEFGFDYNQDVVLIKPKNSDEAYLYGTNLNVNDSVGVICQGDKFIPNRKAIGKFQKYISSDNMTSIRNRCFGFDKTPLPPETPTSFNQRKQQRVQRMKPLQKNESIMWMPEREDSRWSTQLHRACAWEHDEHWRAINEGIEEHLSDEWKERIKLWKDLDILPAQ